jgi:hypothetical protein
MPPQSPQLAKPSRAYSNFAVDKRRKQGYWKKSSSTSLNYNTTSIKISGHQCCVPTAAHHPLSLSKMVDIRRREESAEVKWLSDSFSKNIIKSSSAKLDRRAQQLAFNHASSSSWVLAPAESQSSSQAIQTFFFCYTKFPLGFTYVQFDMQVYYLPPSPSHSQL